MATQTTSNRSRFAAWMMCWGVGLLATSLFACASAPRPVPISSQPLAQAQAANVVVSVPRLDQGDYPGDILDVSTAVLVVIENRGTTEILINPESFTLGSPEGMQYSPVAPEQLAMRQVAPTPSLNQSGLALAWHGGGGGGGHVSMGGGGHVSMGGGMRTAPVYRGGVGGGVRVGPAPGRPYGGGYYGRPGYGYVGRPGYGYYGRPGFGAYGNRLWWGYSNPWLWGPGYGYGWFGSSIWWDSPRYYAWSRADASRMALPAGKLPPGGRTGGFLYFPKVNNPEGSTVYLDWVVRDAATTQPLGQVQLPLELSTQ